MRLQPPLIFLGSLLAILGGIFVSRYRTSATLSVAELTEIALHGPSVKEQTAAAVQLADYGPEALEALRTIASESSQTDVQSACLVGLAKLWDYESMELFFELLETGSARVRGRAAQVVMRMTGRQRRYSANGSPQERKRLVAYMRADWEKIAAASQEDREELFHRLRESHENEN